MTISLKKHILTLTTLALLSLNTSDSYAAIGDSSLVGAPPGVEHLMSQTEVIGFNNDEPYKLVLKGAFPNNPTDVFTIEPLGTVVPHFLPLHDAMFGVFNGSDIGYDAFLGKGPKLITWMYPYDPSSTLQVPPNVTKLEYTQNWNPADSLYEFMCGSVLDCTKDNDLVLGKMGTNYKPLFIGCIQERGVSGESGVKFPIYGKIEEDSISSAEQTATSTTPIAANYLTQMLVAPLKPNDSAQRYVNSKDRKTADNLSGYKAAPADCTKCESWAGAACTKIDKRSLQNITSPVAGVDKTDPTIAFDWWNFFVSLFKGSRNYDLYVAGNIEVPYWDKVNSASGETETDGDMRFARGWAYFPGIPGMEKADKANAVNQIAVHLKSNLFTFEPTDKNPDSQIRFVNKIYTNMAADATAWCYLQMSGLQSCDPKTPENTSCFDYIGPKNTFANVKPNEVKFPDGKKRPVGAIAEWCEAAINGTENTRPDIDGVPDETTGGPGNGSSGSGMPGGNGGGNSGGNGGTPGLAGIPATAQACLAGVEVPDKSKTWNDSNQLLNTLAIAGYYSGNKNLRTGYKFERAYCPATMLAALVTWENPALISASKDEIIAATKPGAEWGISCNENGSGAAGPFQFTPGAWATYKNAIMWAKNDGGFDVGRPDGYVPNRCNLLDSAFAACAMLKNTLHVFRNAVTSCEADEYMDKIPEGWEWSAKNIIRSTCHFYGATGDSVCAEVDANNDGKADGNKCYSSRAVYYRENFTCGPSKPTTPDT